MCPKSHRKSDRKDKRNRPLILGILFLSAVCCWTHGRAPAAKGKGVKTLSARKG